MGIASPARFYKTTDGGQNWHRQQSGVNRDLFGLHFVNPREGWIVGDGGLILHTENGGQNWRLQKRLGERWLYSVYFVDAQTGWVVGVGGDPLHSTRIPI